MLVKPYVLSNLNSTDSVVNKASLNISTGKKINSAIDDPLAFTRLTTVKASISSLAVELNTIDFGMDRLDARDQTLGNMQDTMSRFAELTTMAMSGVNKLSDILPEMQSLRATMVSLGNTQDVNGYMFSGTSGVAPFSLDPTNTTTSYNGNTTATVINIKGVVMNGTVDGTPLMSAFAAMDSVIATVATNTPPTAAQLTTVKASIDTVLAMRTTGAAQTAGANVMKSALQGQSDRQASEVDSLESADLTTETINLTQGQKQYEAILKMTGSTLQQRRLMDFI